MSLSRESGRGKISIRIANQPRFKDTCPNCQQEIRFDKERTDDLDHTHDNGKGTQCRFRGKVTGGKICANAVKIITKKCFKCRAGKPEPENNKDQWNKTGANANRRKCKNCEWRIQGNCSALYHVPKHTTTQQPN